MRRAAILLLACACGSKAGKEPPPPAGARVGAALAAAMDAADHARAPWRCGRRDGPTLATETLTTGGRSYQLGGHVIALAPGPDPKRAGSGRGAITVAVVADAGGGAPETIAALGRLRQKLAGTTDGKDPATSPAAVDLVLVLGGMGTTQAELEATLGALADRAPWLVIALPGDLEGAGTQAAAIAALRGRGAPVIDGRLVRRIDLPNASIATIAGASAASRLVAGADGCVYGADEAAAAISDLTARDGLRVLAATEPPRLTVGGEAAGERFLGGPVDVVIHAPVTARPTAARTGTRDAAAVALSPGTSDANTRLPDGRGVPSAGILTITTPTWRWRPVTAD